MVDVIEGLSGLISGAQKVMDATKDYRDAAANVNNRSLTQSAKGSMIQTKAWVDDMIAHDPVTGNILRTAQVWYAGMIITALQLSAMVTSSSTVRDNLRGVRTSGLEKFIAVEDLLDAKFGALEDDDDKKKGGGSITPVSASDFQLASPDSFPTGKIINVTLTNPEKPEIKYIVPLIIQVLPYLVRSDEMTTILELGTKQSIEQRWTQVRTGELSFWKDFLFQMDQVRKMERTLRNSEGSGFREYVAEVARKDKFRLADILSMAFGKKTSNNIANTILVVSEDAVQEAKARVGLDLTKQDHRRRFFDNTYAMMIFVVDPSHNLVTLYMAGIDDVGNFSFDDFSSKKKADNFDLVKLMRDLSGGRAPRF